MNSPSTMEKKKTLSLSLFFSLLIFPLFHVHLSTAAPFSTPAPPPKSATDVLPGLVGVTYKPNMNTQPPPDEVVSSIISAGIPKVRLSNPDSISVAAFVGSGVELNLSIEDVDVFNSLANSTDSAARWLNITVLPYIHKVRITSISVGYAVISRYQDLSDRLLTAITNVYNATRILNITGMSVSTAHAFEIINNVFPPSSAEFNQSLKPYLKQLLEFEASTQGAFQIDLFPFNLYKNKVIPGVTTSFVMFEAREEDFLDDPVTNKRYRNLFDIMVDAAIVSLVKMGHPTMPVLVVGTGWPSSGNREEVPEATNLYAAEYNERVVSRLNMFLGTPLRPTVTPVTFIYGLFDNPDEDGGSFYSSFGIMNSDLQLKYSINFAPQDTNGAGRGKGASKFALCFSALGTMVAPWLL